MRSWEKASVTFQESETVELKLDYAESIRKDIIAFANTSGGTIYIGIADDSTVVGVSSPDLMIQRIANMARDSIRPDVTMFIHYDPLVVEGRTIVKVSIQRGTGRPYYAADKGLRPSGVYVRQGTAAAPATEAGIRQMIKETDGDTYEDVRSLRQDLTFSYAKEVFARCGLDLEPPQMQTLGIVSSEGIFTNLGLLLSDQCPHIIKAATFLGTDQEQFQDRREFTGSLLKQVDDAYAFLDMRNDTSATFEGVHRIDHRAYPPAALREALLNAIVHRDYAYSASTLISVYSDRIEIVSVGGLIPGFHLNDVTSGLSICRNPKLANVFYRLSLIEAYGTGLKKILAAYHPMEADQLFQVTEKVFKVTLPRLNSGRTSEPHSPAAPQTAEEMILAHLATKELIARQEVERITGTSSSSAARMLKRMVQNGMLIKIGEGKNTRYKLADT
jgi:ATP-dependent DNA helicase RecG